jgi:NAD(P)H-hydrate epimerase
VATPEGAVYVSPTGNPGMATGGSGDVLTGMLAALLGQPGQLDAPAAAVCFGVYLHGAAGDLAAARSGEVSLAASDLIEALPEALARLAGGSGSSQGGPIPPAGGFIPPAGSAR